MSCPNCTPKVPNAPVAISLDSKGIAACVTQWLGMTRGFHPGMELNIAFSWGKEGLKAQITEVPK